MRDEAMAEGMRVRLPTTIAAEDGLPSPSKSKPAQASLLHRLLNRHTILLLMLALTVRRTTLTHTLSHTRAHSCEQRSTQLTRPAFSMHAAVLLRPRRAGHARLPPPPR